MTKSRILTLFVVYLTSLVSVRSVFAAESANHVLVLTGGEADVWRHQLSPEWGEHLIFGPGHLYAARTYYYKGLLHYRERFTRYLEGKEEWAVNVIDLDYASAPKDFSLYRAVVLDDVRAAAIQPSLEALRRYVEGGGNLLISPGAHGFGGHEIQKLELPTLPLKLLVDPPAQGSPYNPIAWSHFTTTSSYRGTALEPILPVKILSQPDFVVFDRRSHGGGRLLDISVVEEDTFLDSVPVEDWQPVGYHKVAAREGARVLATVGPNGDPLVVEAPAGKGRVLVLTANELEGAIRLNGQPTNASINSPENGSEVVLWSFADTFWRAALTSVVDAGEAVTLQVPSSVQVGESLEVLLEDTVAGDTKGRMRVERLGDDRAFYAFQEDFEAVGQKAMLPIGSFPEGSYRVVYEAEAGEKGTLLGSASFEILAAEDVSLEAPMQFGLLQRRERVFPYSIRTETPRGEMTVQVELLSEDRQNVIAEQQSELDATDGGVDEARIRLHGTLSAGTYRLRVTLSESGRPLARTEQPLRIHGDFETPDLFMMIAGVHPSFPVLEDLASNRAVITVQHTNQQVFLPFSEYFGGMPRAPHLTDNLPLNPELRWENWKGEKVPGGNGGTFSWALPEVLEKRDENLRDFAKEIAPYTVHPIVLFDDEPAMPMNGGWEAAALFEKRYGFSAPVPAASYDDPDYMARWTAWEDFRSGIWAEFYDRGTKALKSVNPDIRTAVVVEGMGKDIYAGFDPSISQKPLDIYWFHIYPLNEPLTMVGHAVERGKSALRVMGDPKRERYALLQNWAAVGETPRVPTATYIENQYWMAIAHGATGIGYWPYAYGWWTSAGTPGWAKMGEISDRQRWLAPALRELTDERDPIGLLYSSSQAGLDHLKGLMAKTPQESARPWRNYHVTDEAYHTLKQSGLPFEVVDEREVMAEGADLPYRAIVMGGVEYLREETREALDAFVQAGGDVWKDLSSTIEMEGAQVMPAHFDDVYKLIFPEDPEQFNYFKHRDDFQPLIDANRAIVQEHLAPYDDARVKVEQPGVVWNELDGGDAVYLFLVNNTAHTPNLPAFRKISQEWRLTPVEWKAVQTEVSVKGRKYILDLEHNQLITTETREGRTLWNADVAPAAGLVYVVLNKLPAKLALSAPAKGQSGTDFSFKVTLLDKEGAPLPVVLPLTATLETANGTQTRYLATSDGKGEDSFYLGSDLSGNSELLLRIRQPALGLEVNQRVILQSTNLEVIE